MLVLSETVLMIAIGIKPKSMRISITSTITAENGWARAVFFESMAEISWIIAEMMKKTVFSEAYVGSAGNNARISALTTPSRRMAVSAVLAPCSSPRKIPPSIRP